MRRLKRHTCNIFWNQSITVIYLHTCSILSNLLYSYEWGGFVTWSVFQTILPSSYPYSRSTAFVSIGIQNLIRHMATFISTQRNNLSNGLIRPIRLSESTRHIS